MDDLAHSPPYCAHHAAAALTTTTTTTQLVLLLLQLPPPLSTHMLCCSTTTTTQLLRFHTPTHLHHPWPDVGVGFTIRQVELQVHHVAPLGGEDTITQVVEASDGAALPLVVTVKELHRGRGEDPEEEGKGG